MVVAETITNNNWFICLAVLSANFISFTGNAGYSWTSPFLPKLNGNVDADKNPLSTPITTWEESWITSLHSLGALFSLLLTGPLSEKFGKKCALVIFSVPMFISNILLIFANSVIEFYIARFLLGIGTSCVFSVIPSYIAEITKIEDRGKAGMVMPFMAATTHMFIVSVGPYVSISVFAMFSLIPSILFYLIFVPFVPESPYYYVAQNKVKLAEKSLKILRQKHNVTMEMSEIIKSFKETQTKGSFMEIMKTKTVRKSLLICLGLVICQQVTGAQAVTAYQQEIFHGVSSDIPSHLSVIIVGVFQFIATIIVLGLIDKVGRKKLFLLSYSGLTISLVGLGVYFRLKESKLNVDNLYWLPLLSVIMHMVFFRMGAGPVCWTVVGEIFPSNLKGNLSAVVTSEMVLMSFVMSMIFPPMSIALGMSWTFWIFGTATALSILFIVFKVPEIKGKSFLEIQEILKK